MVLALLGCLPPAIATAQNVPAQPSSANPNFRSPSRRGATIEKDNLLLLRKETAPAALAALSAAEAPERVMRILLRLHALTAEGYGPADGIEAALFRNYTPAARRDAMGQVYAQLYRQAVAAKFFTAENVASAVPGNPPSTAVAPSLQRVLPAEKYPQYAAEVMNFHFGPPTAEYQKQLLALLQALPPVGTVTGKAQPTSPAKVAATEPALGPDGLPVAAPVRPAPAPVISDSSVSGALTLDRTYTTPTGDYVEDQVTGDVYYSPSTGYYPPYYPPAYYPPVVRPPVYPTIPKPPKPNTSKSSFVSPTPYEGEGQFEGETDRVRPPRVRRR